MDAILDPTRVLQLRREAYAKLEVSRDDLSNLLASGRAAGAAAPSEYADLLADIATDLVVNQVDPPKYITQDDADWLVGQLGQGGLGCAAEFEMLVAVIREAVSIPPSLAAFAVGEIEKATTLGHGDRSGARDHAAGIVTHDDVEALRIAVFAATEGSSLHVTRESAEAVFRIARATAGAANDPAFDPFFAGAVANYLSGIANHWTASADEELQEEKSLTEKPTIGSFLGGLLHRNGVDRAARGSVEDAVDRGLLAENAADEQELAQSAVPDEAKIQWLLTQLTTGGRLSPAETALILFLKKESPELSASLLEAATPNVSAPEPVARQAAG
jgi:hypothetical protein